MHCVLSVCVWCTHYGRAAEDKPAFVAAARASTELLLRSAAARTHGAQAEAASSAKAKQPSSAGQRAWVYPLLQMGPWGVRHDETATVELFSALEQGSRVYLTTAYFNLTATYSEAVLRSEAAFNLLLASPQANRFTGAKGLLAAVPAVYNVVAERFHRKVAVRGQADRVQLWEYERDGHSFHAKGLFHYAPGSKHPSLTLIGSPNFGQRSSNRDLECQIAVVTGDTDFSRALHEVGSAATQIAVCGRGGRGARGWGSGRREKERARGRGNENAKVELVTGSCPCLPCTCIPGLGCLVACWWTPSVLLQCTFTRGLACVLVDAEMQKRLTKSGTTFCRVPNPWRWFARDAFLLPPGAKVSVRPGKLGDQEHV